MNNAVFTICARNYIGLAQVLEQSINKYNKDFDFFIFVADEFSSCDENSLLPDNLLIAKNELSFSHEMWNELSFKYDLTEFCTSIKPACFSYFFEKKKYEKVIYLDPDILVYDSLEYVIDKLINYSIILTPHLLHIEPSVKGLVRDNEMLNTGVFNLGFIALRRCEATTLMLEWWNNRLMENCYIDYSEGYYTDQKWMNFMPAYFESGDLLISSHFGMNVAPWNFGERELVIQDNKFYIRDRIQKSPQYPLMFVHFSGFDYKALVSGTIYHSTVRNLKIYEDLLPLLHDYEKLLIKSTFLKYIKMKYTYNFFEGDIPISWIHRRLYRRLLKDNITFSDPFSKSKGSFFEVLKKNNMLSSGSFVVVDKTNRFNTPNIENKVRLVNFLSKIIYKIIGYNRYFMLVKLLKSYSKVENQVHLINASYMKRNIFYKE